jgi:hypothetical protein
MWRLGLACPLVCAALSACGASSPEAATPLPKTQVVPDSEARTLLIRAFHAARAIGREDGACRGCYPTDASEITEDMNARTGDQYAAAATSFEAASGRRLRRNDRRRPAGPCPDHALCAHVERDDLAAPGGARPPPPEPRGVISTG